MSVPSDQHQVDIFASDQQQLHFAELCNALYERELISLSQQSANNISLLQRRLAGLSHHIKRAAEHLLNNNAPIDVDIHNGSWRAKQATKCMVSKAEPDKTHDWFARYGRVGLVVPVYIMEMGIEHIELDSVDRMKPEENKLHTNKLGWFFFDGKSAKSSESALNAQSLMIPTKPTISAACSGHTWNHRGRYQPRTLTLRELLLSTQIDWKTFQ